MENFMSFYRNFLFSFLSFSSLLVETLFSKSQVSKAPIKAICWDMDYTLCQPSQSSLLSALGVGDYSLYTTWDGKSSESLKNCVNDILSLSQPQNPETQEYAYDCNGQLCSPLIVDLLSGSISAEMAQKEALIYIDELNDLHYFYNEREQRLCRNFILFLFDVKQFSDSIECSSEIFSILEEFDECTPYILANWDTESFTCLTHQKSLKKLFSFFNPSQYYISGNCGHTAPSKKFYKSFLKKYDLKPEECLVIDDQKKNIQAAHNCGMHTIHFKNGDFNALRKNIKEILK
jgi:hypothetical protein